MKIRMIFSRIFKSLGITFFVLSFAGGAIADELPFDECSYHACFDFDSLSPDPRDRNETVASYMESSYGSDISVIGVIYNTGYLGPDNYLRNEGAGGPDVITISFNSTLFVNG